MTRDGNAGFSVDAAHAADREKRISYAPRPPHDVPDFAALRTRALAATQQARTTLDDVEASHG
ncbi:hypothetical protein SAMN05216241_103261 [Limimonas halophila]|uniref:Uncharacterized protein n=1 Tax=Limimonas halophila TaxID=1082479 RepID=A0A1G7Q743_9PROT|nr:hypothetical protein [Limimonas halophila]SDF94285.1 hypothetical protein SAMN05216241_103261 [Limimonas halophila]